MLLIGNGRLITRNDGAFFDNGAVVTDGNLIREVGPTAKLKTKYPDAEFIDAKGGVIMPGLINTHNHIYSAFARGLSIKGYNPKNFNDILEGMWWKLDRLLTHENSQLSAKAVYLDCIKNGVTTVFDHHASYFDIPGSLDDIADAAKEFGVRTSVCYEVSDRDGAVKADQAIEENVRMIHRAAQDDSDMLKGMMGMHAAFTLSDETLRRCRNVTPEDAGIHIHVAEGLSDVVDSLQKHGKRIVNRLFDLDLLGMHTIAVHCVHINAQEMDLIRKTDSMIVHNPESNMGNAVGSGPVLQFFNKGILLGLGTDGYTNDMLESYKVGNIIHKHNTCNPACAWGEIPAMLFENNARIAGRFFQRPLGILKEGAYADLIITDYDPLTPMNGSNCNSHILFGMNGRSVVTTICNGKVLMKDRRILVADEKAVMAECRNSAQKLWDSINA